MIQVRSEVGRATFPSRSMTGAYSVLSALPQTVIRSSSPARAGNLVRPELLVWERKSRAGPRKGRSRIGLSALKCRAKAKELIATLKGEEFPLEEGRGNRPERGQEGHIARLGLLELKREA